MRQNKTSKKNRTSYTYYTAEGADITINPGEEGVTKAFIAMLHEADDAEFDANRREAYLAPIRYQAYKDGEGDDAEDRNNYLADPHPNPEESFMASLARAERSSQFRAIWHGLLPQQRDLIKKKRQGRTNVDIAEEENVSEAAIRNRLSKIQAKFKNLR